MTRRSIQPSWSRRFPRWAGLAAMMGGLLGAVAIVLHSLQPEGCIGDQCAVQPMRTASETVMAFGSVATLLVLVGLLGLALMAKQSGRSPRLMTAGAACAVVGFLVLAAAVAVKAVFFDGNFAAMPYFVVTSMLVLIAGFVLIGSFVLRSRVLPQWLGIFLLASSIFLLAANEQTTAVLLAVPFVLGIATAGYFMWSNRPVLSPVPVTRAR